MGCACCKKKDKSIDSNLLKDNMLSCKLHYYKPITKFKISIKK